MREDIPRSIRFPQKLWDAIEDDAKRCKRSSVRQMEAVLSAYYEIEDTEINRNKLEIIGELMPRGKKSMPVLPSVAETEIKKAG